MLADFVMKGIDNLFQQKLALPTQKKNFNQDIIKQNLIHVVRKADHQKSFSKQQNISPNSKSRLRSILQHNKDQKIKSVVKKNKNQRSTSPLSYTKISHTTSIKSLANQNLENFESNQKLKRDQSLIAFYREQRKTIQKSRISENSISQKCKSGIFQYQQSMNFNEFQKEGQKQRYLMDKNSKN